MATLSLKPFERDILDNILSQVDSIDKNISVDPIENTLNLDQEPRKVHPREGETYNRPTKKLKADDLNFANQGRPLVDPTYVFPAKGFVDDGEQEQGTLNRTDSVLDNVISEESLLDFSPSMRSDLPGVYQEIVAPGLLEANDRSFECDFWEKWSEETEETSGELEVRFLDEKVSTTSPASVDATPQQDTNPNPTRERQYVDSVTDNDVISERGGFSKKHPGNKSYLEHCRGKEEKYKNSNNREKRAMTMAVVQWVLGRGGKFLEREDKFSSRWFIMSEAEVFEKVRRW
eukprot:scaffold4531_cov103-Cylindrotheca_fusiformis.AAC.5